MIGQASSLWSGISNWFVALSAWRRVIWLAMCQIFLGLSRKNSLGLVWALAEPLVAVSMIYAIRGLLKMNTPNYGSSLFLFYATGFIPYFMFLRLSSGTRNAGTGPDKRLPGMSALDAYIASLLVNSTIWITMMVALFLGMWWLSDIREISNISISVCAVPIFLLIMLAMGVGMLNTAISRYVPFWNLFYSLATRGLVFLSGILQIVDLQAPHLRYYSILNPLSHAVEWFRLGVWERYPHNSLDEGYLITWVLVCLFLGMVIDRGSIRTLGRFR